MARPRILDEYERAQGDERRRGRRFTSLYEERAQEYDPYADAERAGVATAGRAFEDFGEDLTRLRGALVGRGRLNTGYGAEDENELYEGFRDRLSRDFAERSLQASSLALRNTEGIGQYGQAAQGRYLDLLAGERDRELMERYARQQQQSSLFGSLAGLAGTAIGAFAGGPAGAAVGGTVAKKVVGGK